MRVSPHSRDMFVGMEMSKIQTEFLFFLVSWVVVFFFFSKQRKPVSHVQVLWGWGAFSRRALLQLDKFPTAKLSA